MENNKDVNDEKNKDVNNVKNENNKDVNNVNNKEVSNKKSTFSKVIITLILLGFIGLLTVDGMEYYKNTRPSEDLTGEEELCGQGEGCEVSKKRYKGFEVGDQIPDIELVGFNDEKINLYELIEGKEKFVLSFAADWCSDCERQDEKLNEYYNNLPEEYGAAVVFVDYTSKDGEQTTNKEQTRGYVEKKAYSFPTFWDEDNLIAKDLGHIKATPTNIVLDSNAIIKAKTEEIDADILLLPNKEETYTNMKDLNKEQKEN